jgi:hypothetical protein
MSAPHKQTPERYLQSALKRRVLLSSMALASLVGAPVQAQSFSCAGTLGFGDYTTCGIAGTATLDVGGARTTTGCISAGSAPTAVPLCTFIGTIGTLGSPQIQFSVTPGSVAIQNSALNTMKVNNFKCLAGSAACNFTRTALFLSIQIGARLNLGASQPAGSYSGSFTVNYVIN